MLDFHVLEVSSTEQIMILPSLMLPADQDEAKDRKYGGRTWTPVRTHRLGAALSEAEKKALEVAWEIDELSDGSIPTATILQSAFRDGWNDGVAKKPRGESPRLEFPKHAQAAYKLLLKIELGSKNAIAVRDLLQKINQAGWETSQEEDQA